MSHSQSLHLQSLPLSPTRQGSRWEIIQCAAGISACLLVIIPAITFMSVDVFWHDTDFGTFLGVATWQIVNYVLNGLFTILGILVSSNVASLFGTVQRWFLTRQSGQIPVIALRTPSGATAYNLVRLRLHAPLILISIIAVLSPLFSAVSVFLVDLKQTSHTIIVPMVSQNITKSLDLGNSTALSLTGEEEWLALSTLVLFTTVASLLDKPLTPSDNYTFDCLPGFTCHSPNEALNLIQWSGTVFSGNTTYGFGAPPPVYWGGTPDPPLVDYVDHVSAKLTTATTTRVQRVTYAQSSDFVCKPIPFDNVSVPIGVPAMDDNWKPGEAPTLTQYGIFTEGPCFTRNSTFIIGDSDLLPYFDVQACHTDSELQIQFVVQSRSSSHAVGQEAKYSVEAYSCASSILEGLSTGVETSPGAITVSPPGPGASPIPNTTLAQYTAFLNSYFGFAQSKNFNIGSSRPQGGWAFVPRYNWGVNGVNGNHQWEGATFLAAYANALVSSLGTFFASSQTIEPGSSPETYDTLQKQVIQLGAPVAVGVPLLLLVIVLLLSHLVLLWLYRQELIALDTGDVVDMLLKVDVRGTTKQQNLAELCADDDNSDVSFFTWEGSDRPGGKVAARRIAKEVGRSSADSSVSYELLSSQLR